MCRSTRRCWPGWRGTWSDGTLAYRDGDQTGDLTLALGSVLPYVQWQPTAQVRVWGLGGVGVGELTVDTGEEQAATDMDLRLAALGVTYDLGAGDWGRWAVKADALTVAVDAKATARLPAATGEAQRVRLAVRGSRQWAAWTPSIEVGVRVDDGDAGRGGGVEVGGGLRYVNAAVGLTAETQARVVVAHEADGFREWGAGAAVRYDPGVPGAGLQVELTPQWGTTSSGVETLWSQQQMGPGLPFGAPSAAGRVVAEVRYVGAWLTPFTAVDLAGTGQRVGLGARLDLAAWDVEVVAEQAALGLGPVNHGLRLQVGWRQ